jgi:hypothetical protein
MLILCVSCFKPTSVLDGARYLLSSGNVNPVPLHHKCKPAFEDEHMVRAEYLEPLPVEHE